MINRMNSLGVLLGVLSFGCGGSSTKTTVPQSQEPCAPEESVSDDDVQIDELKFSEIKATFNRKASTISRCHSEGVEAGELDGEDKVTITVGLIIQKDGMPSDVSILERSKQSATLESCAIEAVKRWTFTTLPKPLETSHRYTLQSF